MNKKFLFLLFFIFLIIIIGMIFGIITIYRFSILQDISRKINDNIKKDNYHMTTTVTSDDGTTNTTEAFYRNNVGKLVASNGIYTWADGEYAYMVDEENKTVYLLNINNENIGLVSYSMFASVVPGYNNTIIERLFLAGNLNNKIKKSKLNDKDCFMIKIIDEKYNKTVWIDMVNAIPIKAEIEFDNGSKISYDYIIKFNETRLKDIELPSIDDYTLIDAENEEIIKDSSFNIEN